MGTAKAGGPLRHRYRAAQPRRTGSAPRRPTGGSTTPPALIRSQAIGPRSVGTWPRARRRSGERRRRPAGRVPALAEGLLHVAGGGDASGEGVLEADDPVGARGRRGDGVRLTGWRRRRTPACLAEASIRVDPEVEAVEELLRSRVWTRSMLPPRSRARDGPEKGAHVAGRSRRRPGQPRPREVRRAREATCWGCGRTAAAKGWPRVLVRPGGTRRRCVGRAKRGRRCARRRPRPARCSRRRAAAPPAPSAKPSSVSSSGPAGHAYEVGVANGSIWMMPMAALPASGSGRPDQSPGTGRARRTHRGDGADEECWHPQRDSDPCCPA